MKLTLDAEAERKLSGTRDLVLVERGGLQYYQAFAGVWPGRICTLDFSRYRAAVPTWCWGGPSTGMVIFDKSTTTGLTLLKLRLLFEAFEPVILGSLSTNNGRAGLEVIDLQCEVSFASDEIRIQRPPTTLGGRYLFACDSSRCTEVVSCVAACPAIFLPAWEAVTTLQDPVPGEGPLVINLNGEPLEKAYLVGRVLRRVVVGVTLDPDRSGDVCLDPGARVPSLGRGLAVRMDARALLRMYGSGHE